ncbi:MAG: transcription antitermination factor NusB [Halanaerobiales bacterium]
MIKTSRHQERIWALQILYSLDLTGQINTGQARKGIHQLKEEYVLENEAYYFEELVYGVVENIDAYDQKINKQAIDWNIERMAYIDRNILRIALYEMDNGVPVGVVINEAVEVAKEYADEKSAKFINGILAQINR